MHPPTRSGLTDPVCGMGVTADSAQHVEHAGKTYYFCSTKCMNRFQHDPEKFLFTNPAASPRKRSKAQFIRDRCHPEIRQDDPGTCPKCGMALEPLMPSLEDDNPELDDFCRRFWWTLPFTVIVTVLAMFGPQLGWFEMATQTWIELVAVIPLPVVLWAGQPFFVRGWQSVVNRSPDIWTFLHRLGYRCRLRLQLAGNRSSRYISGNIHVHGACGGLLRSRSGDHFFPYAVWSGAGAHARVPRHTAAVRSLLGLAPKTARRINADGTEEDVPLTHVHEGDRLRVRPGEKFLSMALLKRVQVLSMNPC